MIKVDESFAAHWPVMLDEVISVLNVRSDGVYVDGTYGRGGHSRKILESLGNEGCLWIFDKDPEAIRNASAVNDVRIKVNHNSFAAMADVLRLAGVDTVDGILLDLGISSPQIENKERGFSFQQDALLDMRMDNSKGLTASDWLAIADENQIKEVLYEYAEERFARQIAKKIVATRANQPVSTTRQLSSIVRSCVKAGASKSDPATRTFQAIRIHINSELSDLEAGLTAARALLSPGGRLVVISFHSLEDRIVKRFFRGESSSSRLKKTSSKRVELSRSSRFIPPFRSEDSLTASDTKIDWRQVNRLLPSELEVRGNPRARSAVLRWGERM